MPVFTRRLRRYFYRRPPGIRKRGKILLSLPAIILIIIVVGLCAILMSNKVRPILQRMAANRATNIATIAINDAINDEITNGNVDYNKIIIVEKDVNGNITALKTNMLEVNRIKSDITNKVVERVSGIDSTELNVPLGNLLESEFFSGRGPLIPFKIVPLGSANASFANVFSQAGINQTRHQIVMNVTVDMGVLLPGFSTGVQVTTQVNIAETIIVGSVPQNYAHFNGSLGDILQ